MFKRESKEDCKRVDSASRTSSRCQYDTGTNRTAISLVMRIASDGH